MKDCLLILASGKSSRFGGFPKAFCDIGGKTNAQNTIELARSHFKNIVLVVNEATYETFKDYSSICKLISIKTGQGDAHSLLKALVKTAKIYPSLSEITVCWGDALFTDDYAFSLIDEPATILLDNTSAYSLASFDKNPYAWFNTKEDVITKCFFKSVDGEKDIGLHDQSIFVFDFNYTIQNLTKYMNYLNINSDQEYIKELPEMKLMNFFAYIYDNKLRPAKVLVCEPNHVLSFNSREDLNDIINSVKKYKGGK